MDRHALGWVYALLAVCAGGGELRGDYAEVYAALSGLRGTARWPVPGTDYDDLDSAFGVRVNITTGYDFHRGIDIRGDIGDRVNAVLPGMFWDYTTTSSGNNILTLRHDLAEPVTLHGRTFNHFYTQYHHLDDDTERIIRNWDEQETTVAAGQRIAELGDSGVQGEPHLHFEVRFGTRYSMEAQLGDSDIPDYGFDPHLHPMLLYEPYAYNDGGEPDTYTQQVTLKKPVITGQDIELKYASTNDDMPLLNEVRVTVVRDGDGVVVKEHVLNYNERVGFDPTSTAALDTPDTDWPYLVPTSWPDNAEDYTIGITIPASWLAGFESGFTPRVTVSDIWGNEETLWMGGAPVPEPGAAGAVVGLGMMMLRRSRE